MTDTCELPGCGKPLTTQRYEIRQVHPAQIVTVVVCSWKCMRRFVNLYSMARQETKP